MAIVAKRTVMSLYSDRSDVYSHQVRIVLAEKGVNVDIIPSKYGELSDDLLAMNPYGSLPTLIDRELVLYQASIIMEYLDERFPHPPLLPVYPVARAEARKIIYRIENDWYGLMRDIVAANNAEQAREYLLESIVSLDAAFASKPYFLSDDFSLIDCTLSPLLWRLPSLGVIIPESAIGIHEYMNRVFKRECFQSSLTDIERQLRAA